jgi:hypothetical protein
MATQTTRFSDALLERVLEAVERTLERAWLYDDPAAFAAGVRSAAEAVGALIDLHDRPTDAARRPSGRLTKPSSRHIR